MIIFEQDLCLNIVYNQAEEGDVLPASSLVLLGENNKVIAHKSTKPGAEVILSVKELEQAERVIVTREVDELGEEDIALGRCFTRSQLLQVAQLDGVIDLTRQDWLTWLPNYKVCVSGSVQKCSWLSLFSEFAASQTVNLSSRLSLASLSLVGANLRPLEPNRSAAFATPFNHFCWPVCEGIVEVYERICCPKIVITPPFIEQLCEIIKSRIELIPELPLPPIPNIDPVPPLPYEVGQLFNNGAPNQLLTNGYQDLQVLPTLSLVQAQDYILQRPYLIEIIQDCGAPVLKGATALGQDGEFSFCYSAFPLLQQGILPCRREVAFVVKQDFGEGSVVIYDGVSAGAWFDPNDDDIELTTYNPNAEACEPVSDVPGPSGAYVALARIGTTDSVNLDSPVQTGDYSVDLAGAVTAGLAYPEPILANAIGTNKNRNWGGRLALRFDFSEGMETTKAVYYRICVAQADGAGQPIAGSRTCLDTPISWVYNEPFWDEEEADFKVVRNTLPLTKPDDLTLHQIPYDRLIPGGAWRDNQYHGVLDTTGFAPGKYLVSIELFDESGVTRVVPNGTGISADDQEPFSFETWDQVDETTTVAEGALTHVFWVDNRPMTTIIQDLRKNNLPSSEECQFMEVDPGQADALFSAGFRAYHPQHGPGQPDFLLRWNLYWKRGLGGAESQLDTGFQSTGSGVQPQESDTESFSAMLDTHVRCTFSLMLYAGAKTWNGSTFIDSYSLRDVASFALDRSAVTE